MTGTTFLKRLHVLMDTGSGLCMESDPEVAQSGPGAVPVADCGPDRGSGCDADTGARPAAGADAFPGADPDADSSADREADAKADPGPRAEFDVYLDPFRPVDQQY